jgi:hypothetical protein
VARAWAWSRAALTTGNEYKERTGRCRRLPIVFCVACNMHVLLSPVPPTLRRDTRLAIYVRLGPALSSGPPARPVCDAEVVRRGAGSSPGPRVVRRPWLRVHDRRRRSRDSTSRRRPPRQAEHGRGGERQRDQGDSVSHSRSFPPSAPRSRPDPEELPQPAASSVSPTSAASPKHRGGRSHDLPWPVPLGLPGSNVWHAF